MLDKHQALDSREKVKWMKGKGGKQLTSPRRLLTPAKMKGSSKLGSRIFAQAYQPRLPWLLLQPNWTVSGWSLRLPLFSQRPASLKQLAEKSTPGSGLALQAKRGVWGNIQDALSSKLGLRRTEPEVAISIQSFRPKWAWQPSRNLRGRVHNHTLSTEPWSNNRQQVIKIFKVFRPILGIKSKETHLCKIS